MSECLLTGPSVLYTYGFVWVVMRRYLYFWRNCQPIKQIRFINCTWLDIFYYLAIFLLLALQPMICEASLAALASDPDSCQVAQIVSSSRTIRSILKHQTLPDTYYIGVYGHLRRINGSQEVNLASHGLDTHGHTVRWVYGILWRTEHFRI